MTARIESHRGDTLGKRLARLSFYLRIRAWCGNTAFARMRFLYLASFEGGDASVLKALGIPAEQQLAVDINAESLRDFSAEHPDVPTWHGDVGRLGGRKFDCVFLDFCGNVSHRTIETCVSAAALVPRRDGAVFAWAVQRGREHPTWKPKIAEARELLRTHNGLPLDDAEARMSDGRSLVIYDPVAIAMERERITLHTLCKLTYLSVDPKERAAGKPGTPMLICAYVTTAMPRSWSAQKFARKRAEMMRAHVAELKLASALNVSEVSGVATHGDALARFVATGGRDTERAVRFAHAGGAGADYHDAVSQSALAAAISDCDDLGIDAALALNLDDGRVAALRAHRTRGTYVKKERDDWRRRTEHHLQQAKARGLIPENVSHVVCTDDAFEDAKRALLSVLGDDPELRREIESLQRPA